MRFSNSSVQRLHSGSSPYDRCERQQVTSGTAGRHQSGLAEQVDAPKPIENAQPIRNEFAPTSAAVSAPWKQANKKKSTPVVPRLQHINAVKVIWSTAANQSEKSEGRVDNMHIVLNGCLT